MQLLRKLMPKTLWGQLVSLLLLAMFLSQAIALFIFADKRQIYINSVDEGDLIGRITTIVRLVENTHRNTARRIILNANRHNMGMQRIKLRFATSPAVGKMEHPKYSEELHEKISERLDDKPRQIIVHSFGPARRTFLGDGMPANIRISVKIKPNLWVIANYNNRRPPGGWMAPLLMTMLLMMISILIVVSFVVRKLTKPLGELAKAANDLGRGINVAALKENGTEDVRKVTRSFNQMNDKIKRFVDDRTKMLAAISHDLRTPITSLRLRAEFIEDKEMQNKILETLEEMQMMTEAALKFAKNSNIKEKTKDTDLASLLEVLSSDYQDMGKAVKLKNVEHSQQIILPLRMQAMKRAIRNLIDNGLKYGEQVTIDFKLNSDKNYAKIFITDQGTGIDEADFDVVFEPFYRLEKSRNKDTGGVGLGRSISRDIISTHGGDIVLKNIRKNGVVTGLEVKINLPV
ncbi:MAG: hypothetical protein HRU28_05905 [Rhizobiales bacterium]|nr:hypothetical protein [Hyphomicrobiales bacterium]